MILLSQAEKTVKSKNEIHFLTLALSACARVHYREEQLLRRPRDLLYWNRMYNTLQPFRQVGRRPASSFMCKANRHLLKKAQTHSEQKKLRSTMIKNGC